VTTEHHQHPAAAKAASGWWPQSTWPFASPVGGFAVVDVQTTGLMTHRDRVVEVAVITPDPYGRVIDEWTPRTVPIVM
jgi:hypothetical protein